MGEVSIASSCSVGCPATLTVQAYSTDLSLGAPVLHGENTTLDCPSGYSGSVIVACSVGVASITSDTCQPLPCAVGAGVALALESQSVQHSNEAERAHGASYSLQCDTVNAEYQGSLQVTCQFGNLSADLSTCIGKPCTAETAAEVSVGWLSANLTPSAEVVHGSTWTDNCYAINDEYSGDIALTCRGGVVSAVASCTQMEVGCRFLGQGRQDSISVESYSQALQPTTAVNAGGSWSFDCAGFTEGKYDGSVTVTCGTLGSYASIQNGCTAKQCVAGAGFSASASSHQGSSTLPADIAHQGTSTMDCVNLHEAGSFQLSCSYGELSVDTSACYVVCMTTNSGQAIFGGSVHTVTPSQEVPDGQNFSVPCVDLLAGWQGAVVAHCNGGSVNADASGCTGLPCEAGQSLSVALYDQSQEVALSQDLLHDTAETVACSSINSDYEGNFQLKCFADVLQLDKSGCSCQAQACSTAPCASTDTFSLPLTGVTSPVPIGQAVQSLEMVTLSCDSVAPGHDGSLAVFCSGAVLTPNVSTCTPRGCSSSTAAASVVVGGISSQVLATQALSHGDTFSAATCSSVNSGYSGVVNATCYLGSLVVNADGCHPSPCGVGSSVTLQLDAVSRVHSSQAETTHQGSYAAECSSLDADFYGSFQVACNYGVLTADSSTCIENPCLNTSFVQANVGGSLLTQHPPSEVVHGSVWTAACADVNWDYAGPLHMSCDKGHVGFDNSSCVLVELGCQTTGTGQSITVDNYTWVLLPGQDVAKGESFQVDCASNTEQKFVGEIRVTCGRLGNYSSVENLCVPKSCSAGVDLSVKYRGLEGTVTTSAGLAHLQTETTTCEAVDEAGRFEAELPVRRTHRGHVFLLHGLPAFPASNCGLRRHQPLSGDTTGDRGRQRLLQGLQRLGQRLPGICLGTV
ncbi:unnamed protein product [Effrenium voratum]|nr:unnamed protein product [Effrenium voratum]